MSLLSPFKTSTGIFCFVPISQRLAESGIVSPSDYWGWMRPTDEGRKQDVPCSPAGEKTWSDAKAPLYSTYDADPPHSTPIDTLYGHESASFTSDSTLCDSCDALLRREIPPDHIPSVVRALALFEAQDRIDFDECEVAALANALAMLRL